MNMSNNEILKCDVNNNLDTLLGIETQQPPLLEEELLDPQSWSNLPAVPAPPPPQQNKQEVQYYAPPTEEEIEKEKVDADFELGREVFKELIDKSNVALDELLKVAKASESARAYEVVAKLVETTAGAAKDLLDTHKKRKDLKATPNKIPPIDNSGQQNITVDKAVFVGSSRELLQQMKRENNGNDGN